jgi:glycosyltransferase involved in cell wall biosynthesis
MNLLFSKSLWFYAEFNFRLGIYLLCHRQDIIWSNDLDTLPACRLVSRLKRIPLIYDSHELFTEVPELKYNRFAKKTWKRIEKCIVPKLKYVITVCNPIAEYFAKNYGVSATIVRNLPPKDISFDFNLMHGQFDYIIPTDKPILIWQGSINIERGLEELICAMKQINARLYIIGEGPILNYLRDTVQREQLYGKITFIHRLTFERMMSLTRQATLGLSLDKNTNGNYEISLPNKVFEYIAAHVPILCSDLKEIRHTIGDLKVGEFISEITPEEIARRINNLLLQPDLLAEYKHNTFAASEILCWENEEQKIQNLVWQILNLN